MMHRWSIGIDSTPAAHGSWFAMSTRYPVSLASRARRARAWLASPSPEQMTGRLREPCRATGGGPDVEPRARERAHELFGSGRWCSTPCRSVSELGRRPLFIRSFSFQKENSGSSVTPRAFEGQSRNEKAPRGLSRPGCRSCVRPCSRWCRVHPLSACRAAIGALGRRTSAQAETNITTVETRRLHLCCVMMLCRPCFWGALKLRLVPIFLTSRG